MGCDIHAYLECIETFENGNTHAECVAPDVYIGRNYELFALMAGVRYEAERMNGLAPVSEPKGIPEQLSWRAMDRYTLVVSDEHPDGEGYCSTANAERWLKNGHSVRMGERRVSGPDWHSASWLTVDELKEVQKRYASIAAAPSSWFQSADLAVPEGAVVTPAQAGWMAKHGMVYVEVGARTVKPPHPYLAGIIAMMEAIEQSGIGKTRLVFWFDN